MILQSLNKAERKLETIEFERGEKISQKENGEQKGKMKGDEGSRVREDVARNREKCVEKGVQTGPAVRDEEQRRKAKERVRGASLKQKLAIQEMPADEKVATLEEREMQLIDAVVEREKKIATLREEVDSLKDQLSENMYPILLSFHLTWN